MERFRQRIGRIAGWMAALLITVIVLASAVGCSQASGEIFIVSSEKETAAVHSQTSTSMREEAATARSGTSAQVPETTAAVLESSESVSEKQKALPPKAPSIDEDGTYTSRDDVALYLHTYGRLPSNYITKKEAEELGWKKKPGADGQLDAVAPGKSIGGSRFGNYEGQLPDKDGRHYYECDINYDGGNRGAERLVYSDDGLIYYTGDHYKTFELLYPQE